MVSASQLATRASAGAVIALLIAQWLQLQFPLYAMIAAVIVTRPLCCVGGFMGLGEDRFG